VLGPFQVEMPPLTLQPKDSQPDAGSRKAGPVGWWKLDEVGGSTAVNAAGNKLTGRLHGKPRWAPDSGMHGGALKLDGQSDWVELADSSDLDLRGGLTVAVWIKMQPEAKVGGTLLAKGDAWRLQRAWGKGHLEFNLTGPQVNKKGKPAILVFKEPLKGNEWHHVAGVYDGKTAVLYVDGEPRDSSNASGAIAANNVPVSLGENASVRGRFFDGWIDEARLYAHGLSAEEIKSLFREGRSELAAGGAK